MRGIGIGILTFSRLFLAAALLPITFSKTERCNPKDKAALFNIKESFGNPYLLASWTHDSDCCTSWYQVECDPTTNRITSLTIFAGELSGQIPPAVGDLPFLEKLIFRKLTNVTGPVQPAIAKLKRLSFLRLDHLNLTGSVPGWLGQLKNLTFLDLSFNQLTGSIPAELANLPVLIALHLDRNKLTGRIPDSFGKFSTSLYLSHNQLSGEIPASMADYNTDFEIDLSRNRLEGDASPLFGGNKSVLFVDISRNLFEFDFGKVAAFPPNMSNLDMNHNKIYGKIPAALVNQELQLFNVSYNRLCGEIPTGGKLQSFDSTAYFHNRCLCGSPLEPCK
uniref:Putative serine-threonine protein kinase n=1 Tax=Linum usitatissimum TaxID=4006 RepID=I6YHW8_LINUS|nr:putative serine-threonine protein kinase [Linum usitatissimum]